MKMFLSATVLLGIPLALVLVDKAPAGAVDRTPGPSEYKLLDPITHGDLTVFPVVSAKTHDTSGFLTLDEGIRSGEVVVTEVGNLHSAMQRRPFPQHYSGAQVNTLVLVNNSQRPLILLAGEIVTGGKQDRVVGKDRIVPAESDPIDLTVFCVEPHRWVESSGKFDTHASVMAQPSVRKKAMVDKDQNQVWAEVNTSKDKMVQAWLASPESTTGPLGTVGGPLGITRANLDALNRTSSYAKARENPLVEKQVEAITEPMQKSYESLIKQLRNQNAVGVVVAVKGRIVWADLFASTALLGKYWPKLLQSYAAEALTTPGDRRDLSPKEAWEFLDDWQSRHESQDIEPGLYRQRELVGDRFRAFELTSLLQNAEYDVHLSKLAE